MATSLRKTDVVVIGLGAAGGVAVLPLTQAGIEVTALDAGVSLDVRDMVPDELKLNRVEIQCARENHRSRAVPIRLGFVEEGTLRQAGTAESGFVDHVVYGMLASEWPTTPVRSSTARD